MVEHRTRAVQMFSQEEIFRAIAYGALKARAGRLSPGSIMEIGEFMLTVVEDENGEGYSVQIIESLDRMEETALGKARSFDQSLEGWTDHEIRVWLADFWKDLAIYLEKWQKIIEMYLQRGMSHPLIRRDEHEFIHLGDLRMPEVLDILEWIALLLPSREQ